jgi:hypothetical protein
MEQERHTELHERHNNKRTGKESNKRGTRVTREGEQQENKERATRKVESNSRERCAQGRYLFKGERRFQPSHSLRSAVRARLERSERLLQTRKG